MRISDWSSDVCSSDLPVHAGQLEFVLEVRHRAQPAQQDSTTDFRDEMRQQRIETANLAVAVVRQRVAGQVHAQLPLQRRAIGRALETGKATSRDRVCPYVLLPVGAVTLKKKKEDQ